MTTTRNPKLSQTMITGLVHFAYEAMGRDDWRVKYPATGTCAALVTRKLITAGHANEINDAGRAALLDALNGDEFDVPSLPELRTFLAPVRFEVKRAGFTADGATKWGVWDLRLARFASDYHVSEQDAADVADEENHTAQRITVRLVNGVAVHTLGDFYARTDGSGELAYAYTQTSEAFHDGDVLVVGGTVAVMIKAWPTAVTVDTRELHTLTDTVDWTRMDGGQYAQAYRVAVTVAEQLGADVRPNGTEIPPDERRPLTLDEALRTADTPLFCAACAVRDTEHATTGQAKRQERACDRRQDEVTRVPMMPVHGPCDTWPQWRDAWLTYSAVAQDADPVRTSLVSRGLIPPTPVESLSTWPPTATETVMCSRCRREFESERIDGQLQCVDGNGHPTCDDCYDESTGYARPDDDDDESEDTSRIEPAEIPTGDADVRRQVLGAP